VAELAAGLAHRASALVGRVILLRGWVLGAQVWVPPPRPQWVFSVESSPPRAPLLQRLLALLHLAAGPQQVQWGYPATYRVLILPRTTARCHAHGPCDDGVLLGARAR
jgi:hypothetical protein